MKSRNRVVTCLQDGLMRHFFIRKLGRIRLSQLVSLASS